MRVFFLCIALLALDLRGASVVISEFMAANTSTLADEDNEFSDWIEIHNATSAPVSLAGWGLSDEEDNPQKWTFPAVTIPGRGFMVVFASGKNRINPASRLHTNFKLDPTGESVVLSDASGQIVSSIINYPRQLPNISYGISMITETDVLLPFNSQGRMFVPSGSAPPANWMAPDFSDAGWTSVVMGIGYDRIPEGQYDPAEPPVTSVDVTRPGDQIFPTSGNSPGNEGVTLAIDNNPQTKYLNFDKLDAGFTVSPSNPQTVVTGLRVTSANDAPERDPTSFILSGSNGGAFTEIARGPLPNFQNRFTAVEVSFGNNTAYTQYRLIFPTVRDAAAAVAMQISEVEFLGKVNESVPSFRPFISTSVEANVFGKASSAYLRIPFDIAAGQSMENLTLRLRYDDGFAAYLNGSQIAKSNAPVSMAFNAFALTNRFRRESVREAVINLNQFAELFRTGQNIFAAQVWNDRLDSADFLLQAQLENNRFTAGAQGYFQASSPGNANTLASAGVVSDVEPMMPRGFYDAPFDLTLLTANPEAVIRYTTDGSPPSATTGRVYTAPIRIDRTTILRAGAFRPGWLPSRVATVTYIFLDDVLKQTQASALNAGLPATWNGVTADYGLDSRIVGPNDQFGGKYVRSIKNDMKSVPVVSIVTKQDDMFGSAEGLIPNSTSRGEAWERPGSIEFFNLPGEPGFQADAGFRVQGGAFRQFNLSMKKSFRVIFREDYGVSNLRYPLFGDNAANEFQNFVLRANGNDAWRYGGSGALYMRDAFAMDTVRAMGSVSSHTRFVHLYINGLYWGLYNLVERPDAAFSASYHGGERDTWDAINQDSAPDGDFEAWNRLLNAVSGDTSNNELYQRIQGRNPDGTRNPAYENLIDIDSMIDYMIMNLYVGNLDWPHRNWWTGRDRNNGDGFKFYPWDTETALGATGNPDVTGVSGAVATPYAALRRNADFRMRFADHVHRHFFNGGALYVNPTNSAWSPLRPQDNVPAARFYNISQSIRSAVVGESARWGDQLATSSYTRDEHWDAERTRMLTTWFPQRSATVLNQFRNAGLYPRTDAPVMNARSGQVDRGFQLAMSAAAGSIFYTTNGLDPKSPVEFKEVSRQVLVPTNAAKRVFIPSVGNGGDTLGTQWHGAQEPFNDSSWMSGNGGVGYDTDPSYRPYIGIDVQSAMYGKVASAYIRVPFDFNGDPAKINFLIIRAQVDDGFVAFLNGTRMGAKNPPAALTWNAGAGAGNPDANAVIFENIATDDGVPALKAGRNILAIHALNAGAASADFLLNFELLGGELAAGTNTAAAMRYTGPLTLNDLTTIKARTLNNGEWSALNEAHFIVGQPRLVLSELYYHPAGPTPEEQAAGFLDDEAFEYIELWNNGSATYDLSGVSLTRGVEFNFENSAITRLGPGQFVLIVNDRVAFEKRFGTNLPVAGEYTGNLSNGGERISLMNGTNTVFDFSYGASSPWPRTPDGEGPSLEIADPDGNPAAGANWRASTFPGGSPGQKNPPATVRLQNIAVEAGQLRFTFSGRAGTAYEVSATADLANPDWQVLRAIATLSESQILKVQIDLPQEAGAQFVRVSSK